ncbi:hypothetical protein MJO28_003213, partial [Puccinia striiformis f. sp. tritici]
YSARFAVIGWLKYRFHPAATNITSLCCNPLLTADSTVAVNKDNPADMFPEKICNHLKNDTNEAKLVYHFAEVLGNPALDDCHQSVVDAMLQHYINKFKKATVDLITHKDVLTSASGIHQTMKDSSSKPLQPTKKPFPLSQGNDTSDDEEVESSCTYALSPTFPQILIEHDQGVPSRITERTPLFSADDRGPINSKDTTQMPIENQTFAFAASGDPSLEPLTSQASASVPPGGSTTSVDQTSRLSHSTITSGHLRIQPPSRAEKQFSVANNGQNSIISLSLPLEQSIAIMEQTTDVNTTRLVNPEEIVSTPKRPRILPKSIGSAQADLFQLLRCLHLNPKRKGTKLQDQMESHLKGLVKIRAIGLPSPERLPRPNNQRKQRRLTGKQLAANSKGTARSKAPSKDLTKPTASGSRINDWVCPTGANLDLALQVEARRLDTLAASEDYASLKLTQHCCSALFRNLPAGAFNQLDFWEKTKNKPADPLKNKKNIANADMIISQLPKLLGRRVRARRAIESSMFINTDTCLDRAKAGGLINTSLTDPIIGSSFINREVLNPHHSSFKVVISHPLYPCLSFTHEPLSQGWTRFIATLADIQSLLTKDRLALTLASLEGIEGNSDEALLKVHTYFHDLAAAFNVRKSANPLNVNIPKDYFGSHGGMAYFFEYIASALCALVSFRFGAVESRKERPTILSKATYEKKPNGLTKGLSCLAQLLVIGPGAIFSQPTARDLYPQWKTSMLLEFGAIAVETQTKNSLEPSRPIWSPFGNTRLHIIKTFAQMGFGHNAPIDWTLLLETFQENFSSPRLAHVIWDDIVLITDRESAGDNKIEWGA